jgi:hypothetical protein
MVEEIMIRTSQNTEQLDEAFAKAQAKFEAAAKSASNPAYRSKYADISSIIDATLAHLNSEGICVRQHPALEFKGEGESREAFITVTTKLSYKGQFEESDLSIPAIQRDRFDAQSCGSAITYACRYALQGIFCVSREDDDANSASGVGTREQAQAVATKKIDELKSKKAPPSTNMLFYVWPEKHEGRYAEWINIREYAAALPGENQVTLQGFFQPFLSKQISKSGSWMVPAERMNELTTGLSDMGIQYQELKAGQGAGQ